MDPSHDASPSGDAASASPGISESQSIDMLTHAMTQLGSETGAEAASASSGAGAEGEDNENEVAARTNAALMETAAAGVAVSVTVREAEDEEGAQEGRGDAAEGAAADSSVDASVPAPTAAVPGGVQRHRSDEDHTTLVVDGRPMPRPFPAGFCAVLQLEPEQVVLQVGDYVRLRRTILVPLNRALVHGDVYRVVSMDADGDPVVQVFPGTTTWAKWSELQRAVYLEPGDRVRMRSSVQEPNFGWGGVDPASMFVTRAVDCLNSVALLRVGARTDFLAKVDELEWVTQHEDRHMRGGLPVGMHVRMSEHILRSRYGDGNVHRGEVGVVVEVDSDGDPIVRFPSHDRWQGFYHDLEDARAWCLGDLVQLKEEVTCSSGTTYAAGHVGMLLHVKEDGRALVELENDYLAIPLDKLTDATSPAADAQLYIARAMLPGTRVRIRTAELAAAAGLNQDQVGIVVGSRFSPEHNSWIIGAAFPGNHEWVGRVHDLARDPPEVMAGDWVSLNPTLSIPDFSWGDAQGKVRHGDVGVVADVQPLEMGGRRTTTFDVLWPGGVHMRVTQRDIVTATRPLDPSVMQEVPEAAASARPRFALGEGIEVHVSEAEVSGGAAGAEAVARTWERGLVARVREGAVPAVDVRLASGRVVSMVPHDRARHPEAARPGRRVRMIASTERAEALAQDHGGWVAGMAAYCGQAGVVSSATPTGDLRVTFADGRTWTLNPDAVEQAEEEEDQQHGQGLQASVGGAGAESAAPAAAAPPSEQQESESASAASAARVDAAGAGSDQPASDSDGRPPFPVPSTVEVVASAQQLEDHTQRAGLLWSGTLGAYAGQRGDVAGYTDAGGVRVAMDDGSTQVLPASALKRVLTRGARVQALWQGGTVWFAGYIERVHPDGTMDIVYDDGDREDELAPDLVRPLDEEEAAQE